MEEKMLDMLIKSNLSKGVTLFKKLFLDLEYPQENINYFEKIVKENAKSIDTEWYKTIMSSFDMPTIIIFLDIIFKYVDHLEILLCHQCCNLYSNKHINEEEIKLFYDHLYNNYPIITENLFRKACVNSNIEIKLFTLQYFNEKYGYFLGKESYDDYIKLLKSCKSDMGIYKLFPSDDFITIKCSDNKLLYIPKQCIINIPYFEAGGRFKEGDSYTIDYTFDDLVNFFYWYSINNCTVLCEVDTSDDLYFLKCPISKNVLNIVDIMNGISTSAIIYLDVFMHICDIFLLHESLVGIAFEIETILYYIFVDDINHPKKKENISTNHDLLNTSLENGTLHSLTLKTLNSYKQYIVKGLLMNTQSGDIKLQLSNQMFSVHSFYVPELCDNDLVNRFIHHLYVEDAQFIELVKICYTCDYYNMIIIHDLLMCSSKKDATINKIIDMFYLYTVTHSEILKSNLYNIWIEDPRMIIHALNQPNCTQGNLCNILKTVYTSYHYKDVTKTLQPVNAYDFMLEDFIKHDKRLSLTLKESPFLIVCPNKCCSNKHPIPCVYMSSFNLPTDTNLLGELLKCQHIEVTIHLADMYNLQYTKSLIKCIIDTEYVTNNVIDSFNN